MSRHAINESIVKSVAGSYSDTVSYQSLTESLNLFQALLATEQEIPRFFEKLDRPEQLHECTDTYVNALVTPITWWELQAHSNWGNTMDCAVLEAHKRQFLAEVDAPTETYDDHQLTTLHPVVALLPTHED